LTDESVKVESIYSTAIADMAKGQKDVNTIMRETAALADKNGGGIEKCG
jgi:hypothetical protein